MRISHKEYEKFSKQIILKRFGIIGQKKIKSSKVLVIGMGGLGCPLSVYLTSLGIGTLGIVDSDKIELSNLNRQIIYGTEDIGKFKVDVAKQKIKRNNIQKLIKSYDIICDGTDNFETRLLINDHSLKQKKILISAAVTGFEGHIYKFDFRKKTPCYRCFMPEIPDQNLNCGNEGVTPTITGVIGTMQANEVLNTILGLKSKMEKKMMIFDSIKMNLRKINFARDNSCKNKC